MASRLTQPRRQPIHEQETQSRAKWTTSLTKTLADLMVDHVYKGNRQKKSFSKKAWESMCEEFHKKTSLKWDIDQLKNRFSILRRQYAIVKSLLDQGDFSWDESASTIIATNEAWVKYIEVHPDAESIRSAGCPLYKQLCTIFSEASPITTNYNQLVEYKEAKPHISPCPEPLTTLREESSSESEEVDDKSHFLTPPCGAESHTRGRKGVNSAIAHAILEMSSASKLRTDAIRQRNARFSLSEVITELDELQDVDDDVYFAALDLFENNTISREVFLCLKADKRLTWLNRKLLSHLVSYI